MKKVYLISALLLALLFSYSAFAFLSGGWSKPLYNSVVNLKNGGKVNITLGPSGQYFQRVPEGQPSRANGCGGGGGGINQQNWIVIQGLMKGGCNQKLLNRICDFHDWCYAKCASDTNSTEADWLHYCDAQLMGAITKVADFVCLPQTASANIAMFKRSPWREAFLSAQRNSGCMSTSEKRATSHAERIKQEALKAAEKIRNQSK